MGAKASSLVCVSESIPVCFAFLHLLCNLGASQCPGSYTYGVCHQRQLLHSPSEQDMCATVHTPGSQYLWARPPLIHNVCVCVCVCVVARTPSTCGQGRR